MPDLPSGIVTFVFTDIIGSTQLWERAPTSMARCLERHDLLLRSAIEAAGGHVFKTVGDAFHAVFEDPVAAIVSAVTAQRALSAATWPSECNIHVRMATHSGVAEVRGMDYFGATLNQTARLISTSHGGQIVVTQVTQHLVADSLPADIGLQDLGTHRLRDVARAVRVFQILAPGLAQHFPPLHSLTDHPTNLTDHPNRFVGRSAEVAGIREHLSARPLVTLVGPGGSGKSRLAQQVAEAEIPSYPDGVWWIGLGAVADSASAPTALASALGITEQPGRSMLATLGDALRGHQTLLVMDNCEHLLAGVTNTVSTLLKSCPNLRILATSRGPLSTAGEWVWPVPPLKPPAASRHSTTLAEVAANEAVLLFVDRAQAVAPGFQLTEANAACVAEICRRLDGIPLALELAAARLRVLAVEKLRDRLDDRFRLLVGTGDRHGSHLPTLRAAIDWSYDLLPELEQRLFQRLSVFAGGWSLEAAEHVCAGDDIEPWQVLDLMSGVVDKSLVVVQHEVEPPYRMLETLRAYARERLHASGEADAVARKHAAWYADLAATVGPELVGSRMQARLEHLDTEHENLAAALRWTAQNEPSLGRRIGGALWRLWLLRGRFEEGRTLLQAQVPAGDDVEDLVELAMTLHGLGTLLVFQGDLKEGRRVLERALDIWQRLDEPVRLAHTLNNLAQVVYEQGDFGRAAELFSESLARKRAAGDRRGAANTLGNMGAVQLELGDLTAARASYEEALAAARELNDAELIAGQLLNLSQVAGNSGEYPQAESLLEESLQLRRQLGDEAGVAEAQRCLGVVAREAGRLDEARALLAEAVHTERMMGSRFGLAEALKDWGMLLADAGESGAAKSALEESLSIQDSIGHLRGRVRCLVGLARVALLTGELATASNHLRTCLALVLDTLALDLRLDPAAVAAELAAAQGDRAQIALQILSAVEHQRAAHGWSPTERRREEVLNARVLASEHLSASQVARARRDGEGMSVSEIVDLARSLLATDGPGPGA